MKVILESGEVLRFLDFDKNTETLLDHCTRYFDKSFPDKGEAFVSAVRGDDAISSLTITLRRRDTPVYIQVEIDGGHICHGFLVFGKDEYLINNYSSLETACRAVESMVP